ncbi:MAG: c-type cytochrome, partial [Actinomycetota bacterium]
MTEIPEHLLKRSRDRKAGGSGDSAGAPSSPGSEVVAATPATRATRAAAPEPVAPPVKPDPPYVAAAKKRGRIPSWAMLTLSLLPLFVFMYVRGLQPQKAEASGPILIGQENYGACASCHGADGSGGAGRVLKDGESLLTFPHIEDMLNWVYIGSEA